MSLVETYIDGYVVDKVKTAIERIQNAYQIAEAQGLGSLYVCYSGGKDSTVIAELAKMSGVPYELHYNITGIDPPEVVYFMREHFNAIDGETLKPIRPRGEEKVDLHWHMYKKSMWRLIVENHMPPTRLVRYCCRELKEGGGEGRMCVTGVRWAESVRRKNTRMVFESCETDKSKKVMFNDNDDARRGLENCIVKHRLICNPIVDWDDADVWEFIRSENLPYCKLYDEGQRRLGCIGCPMSTPKDRSKDFKLYPKMKNLYIKAFERMIVETPSVTWKTGEEVFDWWMAKVETSKTIKGQVEMEER